MPKRTIIGVYFSTEDGAQEYVLRKKKTNSRAKFDILYDDKKYVVVKRSYARIHFPEMFQRASQNPNHICDCGDIYPRGSKCSVCGR